MSTAARRISWRNALSWRHASASPASELKKAWRMRTMPVLPLNGLSVSSSTARVAAAAGPVASGGFSKGGLHGSGGDEARKELARAVLPGVAASVTRHLLAIERERLHRGGAEIVVEDAGRRILHDVDRSPHRECRHRRAAGHRFGEHQAEGVGAAWKHEDIGALIVARELGADPGAREHRVRKALLQFLAL